jgi:NAD-dependent deacetylase
MEPAKRDAFSNAVSLVQRSKNVAVLTGAGISAESGVPTFRGHGGLWEGRRPEDVATPEAFHRDPRDVWNFYRWRIKNLDGVQPNPGHYALAEWETRVDNFWLITQNIDGLHTAAGSKNVIEIHGTIREARCSECDHRMDMKKAIEFDVPECERCHALMRPAVVWFGEMLPPAALAAAQHAIEHCNLMLVAGTSGVVQPAASFAVWAKQTGAAVIEVNLEDTPLSPIADVSLFGKSGEILPRLLAEA